MRGDLSMKADTLTNTIFRALMAITVCFDLETR